MANALSAEKQRTKLCVTQTSTFKLCHLLSILCMHIINPIWLHGKEIISLNDAILELTNSVLSPHALVTARLDDISWGLLKSFCKNTREKKILTNEHPHVSCYMSPATFNVAHDTPIFKMDNQQGPTIQHRELCSMSCGSLGGRGVWGKTDTKLPAM